MIFATCLLLCVSWQHAVHTRQLLQKCKINLVQAYSSIAGYEHTQKSASLYNLSQQNWHLYVCEARFNTSTSQGHGVACCPDRDESELYSDEPRSHFLNWRTLAWRCNGYSEKHNFHFAFDRLLQPFRAHFIFKGAALGVPFREIGTAEIDTCMHALTDFNLVVVSYNCQFAKLHSLPIFHATYGKYY